MFCHQHVVITQEHHSRAYFRSAGEIDPLADHVLSFQVSWVGFPSEHQLDGVLFIGQDLKQPTQIMQKQIRTFVRRKAARKAHYKRVGVENLLSSGDVLKRSPLACKLSGVLLANVVDERFSGIGAQLLKVHL